MTENDLSPAKPSRERPAFGAADPTVLAEEQALLAQLAGASRAHRWRGYLRLTGPGWLQSAFTLGSGSAVASLYLGAHYGYSLLWVQPLAMVVGIVMLMAASHQTLSTGVRPFEAMRRYIHPGLAWAWAIATLIATFVFHLPQYALAAGVTEDMVAAATAWQPAGRTRTAFLVGIGLVILGVSTLITWTYGRGIRGTRLYERTLKALVGVMILAFFAVVARSVMAGQVDLRSLLTGFLPISVPSDPAGVTTVAGAFGAAVGINMTFLFGYTLLARGWGREHRGLAKFDLITGTFLPYVIVTSLIVIACACTIHGTEFAPEQILPANVGVLIGSTGVGPTFGRFVFGLGVLGMALSTITLQMLVAGFALCELLGIEAAGWRYRLACLLPAPAFLGVVLWTSMGTWIALPAFTIGLIMLPIAYIGWLALHNSSRFLGDDRPRGRSALRWNLVLGISLLITLASVAYTLVQRF
ncbi:MAG: divalent metal cation transporter [Gemmatimonadota bacterium]|nr:MAG: divalent metal cation transporter [Gemmatimonadota bacterium]